MARQPTKPGSTTDRQLQCEFDALSRKAAAQVVKQSKEQLIKYSGKPSAECEVKDHLMQTQFKNNRESPQS
ncbi:unnamed protein product [Clavelina lepadiformis]|uniref:Uncharacterized protein n=1 Tax=Clavelina lepadiformis TaxID=159417 RepID=A0ABP0FLD5_CLALP